MYKQSPVYNNEYSRHSRHSSGQETCTFQTQQMTQPCQSPSPCSSPCKSPSKKKRCDLEEKKRLRDIKRCQKVFNYASMKCNQDQYDLKVNKFRDPRSIGLGCTTTCDYISTFARDEFGNYVS